MPTLILMRRVLAFAFFSIFSLPLLASPLLAQSSGGAVKLGENAHPFVESPVTVNINVRDSRGFPVNAPASVHFYSQIHPYDVRSSTQDGAVASFHSVVPGEYVVEIHCPSYQPTTENISVVAWGTDFTTYIYLHPDSETSPASASPAGVTMTPKLQALIDKGMDAVRKKQYDSAKAIFTKASQMAPANPDVIYLLGTAELGLQHTALARQDFEHALSIAPAHEKSLLSLGELQLRAGETDSAIATLQEAYLVNGASWRTHLLLAAAYASARKFPDAEDHAHRAVALAQDKAAPALLMLAQVQAAQGKHAEARRSWELLIARFPNDPLAATARQNLSKADPQILPASSPSQDYGLLLPTAAISSVSLLPVEDRPWAPPDIDEKEYPVAPNASCNLDDVLASALHRMNSQLRNFEKFTATEHIEHQDIDRFGRPGPIRSRDFSYIVFVHPFQENSLYLEESRDGTSGVSAFPTSLATIGLNGLAVSVLQPAYRNSFNYQCQGLANLRGQAAWQLRFQEKQNSRTGVRLWQRNGSLFDLPIKGRLWISPSTFDVLRVETDLTQPDRKLELTRDHLLVDYGPVKFPSSNTQLWLPWTAEMYMELHGKRYHHKHFLTDYLLFAVDTSNKIAKPKETPPPAPDSASPQSPAPAGSPSPK